MIQKKEWSFGEVWDIVEKFNELAETDENYSLAEIYNKLADDFNCTEEDVVSIFDTLNDDYEHLIKTQYAYEKTNQSIAKLSFPEEHKQLESDFRLAIKNNVKFLTDLQQWKKLIDERFNN